MQTLAMTFQIVNLVIIVALLAVSFLALVALSKFLIGYIKGKQPILERNETYVQKADFNGINSGFHANHSDHRPGKH
ncbi:MAG: hypothetical protein FWG68_07745 [Defluviitaleaceae bacterium]|nr:hypothetical protein [Defluviitaleaceae bacterium]